MNQLPLTLSPAAETKRLSKDQVRCSGCQAVYQRPAYSLQERQRRQILCCPCGVKTEIPGEKE